MKFKKVFNFKRKIPLFISPSLLRKSYPEIYKNYLEIGKRLHITYRLFEGNFESGYEALMKGDKRKSRKIAQENNKKFQKQSIKEIIVADSQTYYMLKKIYPTFILNYSIQVYHISEVILKALKKRKYSLPTNESETFIFHDSQHLLNEGEIYTQPREVIALLGGKIINKDSFPCGANGGLFHQFSTLSKKISKQCIKKTNPHNNKILLCCPYCLRSLQEEYDKTYEWSGFILGKLRGRKK